VQYIPSPAWLCSSPQSPITAAMAAARAASCGLHDALSTDDHDQAIGIPARQDQWKRNLKIILDGMRARGGMA
jgi:hypothetical protein